MRFGYLKRMDGCWTEPEAVTGNTSTQSGLESSLWQVILARIWLQGHGRAFSDKRS